MGMFDDPNWPGLTFNPAKGDLHTIESLAYDVKTVGDELDEMREMLLSIGKTDGVWDGDAAKKFQDKVGELPKYLKQGHESMNACSRALRSWHDELQTMQQRAKGLEDQAFEARKRLDQKNDAVDRVNVKIEGAMFRQLTEQEAKALGEEADSASAAAKEAAADLESLIRKGEELRKNWEEQAEKAEKAIREASKNRPPDISIWDKITDGLKGAWDGFKNFLIDNADLFSTISAALATAAIVVNVIPIGGQVASAILGAGSMVFAGAAAAGHYMGGAPLWKVGLDIAGVLPGIGVVKGLTAGVRGAKGMVSAGRGLMDGIKNGLVTQGINKGIASTVGRFLPAAKNIDPWKVSLPMKAGSAIFGAGKMIFGGDEGGNSAPPVTTQPAPADRPSVVDQPPVQTMPYPATGDKFHATLAA
ncbi:hypothetical protein SAMN04487981_13164 [Streptomyces sp. cf386]|uniref:putative T7SS-secreted protein n=1 Tax=Streptomyces sp. cf386 TaxID=1761904 RepID=UPI000883BAE4|nr:hypothetical protein [Streptomyces sp. cf386]SDP65869.1 hypothetical protein SAMN04487981_13164 [Streptomyces sp. cf386]